MPRQNPAERLSSWSGEESGGEESRGALHGAPALGLSLCQLGLAALDDKLLATTLKVSAVKRKAQGSTPQHRLFYFTLFCSNKPTHSLLRGPRLPLYFQLRPVTIEARVPKL